MKKIAEYQEKIDKYINKLKNKNYENRKCYTFKKIPRISVKNII